MGPHSASPWHVGGRWRGQGPWIRCQGLPIEVDCRLPHQYSRRGGRRQVGVDGDKVVSISSRDVHSGLSALSAKDEMEL